MIELSVITVTRNRCALLLKKLETLSQQTLDFSCFELVLCINGTEDDSQARVESLNLPFKTTVLINDHNEPVGKARNACVEAAQGKYIYFSDDDVWLEPETLAIHLHFHRNHTMQTIAIGHISWHDSITNAQSIQAPQKVDYAYVCGATTSMARQFFLNVGGFVDWLLGYGHEDVLLGYMLQQHAARFVVVAARVHHYGANPTHTHDKIKPYQAGQNAVRIAKRYPQLAFRLGVHPLSLFIKGIAFLPPFKCLWQHYPNFSYELRYFQGALNQRYVNM